MSSIISSPIFILLLVISSYLLGKQVFKWSKITILNPVLLAIVIVIGVVKFLDIDYSTFKEGSELIDFMLGPSVVAIGYSLYQQIDTLRGKLFSIITSVTVGAAVGISSVILVCRALGCDDIITLSLQAKSVTTPIALSLTEKSGGIGSLAAIAVVITGITGSIIAPPLLKLFKIDSKSAKGLAMGTSAHGMGTAKALEMGAVEGAISGLAIGLMGVATSLLMPVMESIFY